MRYLLALLLLPWWVATAEAAFFEAETFTLDNGLQVVVIPNHRAPLVTQVVFYKVGQADETAGKSGLAHFLEHLMFKGTKNAAPGEFSAAVAAMGGEENAFTTADYTAYYQTVDRDRLETVMRYEADRMANLILDDAAVLPERDVILEERRQRTDNDPGARLAERVDNAVFANHPYRIPVIGWEHEIAALTAQDALDWYDTWYAPNNAILLLGGDITAAEARPLVERYYGPVARKAVPERQRPLEPPAWTARRVSLADPAVQQEALSLVYRGPHRSEMAPGEEEALDVLTTILGGGGSSRLYRALVVDRPLAASAGAWMQSGALDYGTLYAYAVPREGVDLATLEAALQAEIQRLLTEGVSDEEVAKAKRRLADQAVFSRDDPSTLPVLVGSSMAIGLSLDWIQAWPERLEGVTAAQVNAAARRVLTPANSVTGLLSKEPPPS